MKKLVLLLVSAAFVASAQTADNPLSTSTKALYGMVKNYVIRSAEKVPEADYSYKPTPEVRSFGQLVAHVADANYAFCSAVLGEKPPVSGIEKTKTTKAELVEALKDSFTYCDKAYDGMTDAQAAQMADLFGGKRPKLTILNFNNMHDDEHYGNMVTYMRLKGIVPPSSEPRKK
jgi:uncharacterized damage-inducible protein DinB